RVRKVKYNPSKPPARPRLLPRRPEGWNTVTVCIAAIAMYGGTDEWSVVTASDRPIGSSEVGSSEGHTKVERLSKDWRVMFDGDRNPQVFKVVENWGTGAEDIDCRWPGFAAIGVGTKPAEVILYALDQNPHTPWTETIYNVCAAKFMAERVSGVGRDTFLYVR